MMIRSLCAVLRGLINDYYDDVVDDDDRELLYHQIASVYNIYENKS
jgi:hypothetical protein